MVQEGQLLGRGLMRYNRGVGVGRAGGRCSAARIATAGVCSASGGGSAQDKGTRVLDQTLTDGRRLVRRGSARGCGTSRHPELLLREVV